MMLLTDRAATILKSVLMDFLLVSTPVKHLFSCVTYKGQMVAWEVGFN